MRKEEKLELGERGINFWFCAALLAMLVTTNVVRDINRPFYGLHSWGQASGAWAARCHVKYGLGYTRGKSTFAVGDPPSATPRHYLDHPQLGGLINAAGMAIFGINEWGRRAFSLIPSILTLLLLLRILRGLVGEKIALLAGLILVMFPLSCYFGIGYWFTMLAFLALYNYLVIIEALSDGPPPGTKHKVILGICLFFMVQLSWSGFFHAFTIGSHYIIHCIRRKQFPQINLLAILAIAPLFSLFLVFLVMAAGYEWDIDKIVELYKWRAGRGEVIAEGQPFDWGMWFGKIWEFGATNFTALAMITAILYMIVGQLITLVRETHGKKVYFPQLYLILMPGVYKLFTLKGMVWKHQFYQRVFSPFLAISIALAMMLVYDVLKKVNRKLAVVVPGAFLALLFGLCMVGTNHYYSIRWQAPEKIEMFKFLNKRIPPDKGLLSFEDFIVNQHSSKGGFYRPEIAWYLDREIVPARSSKEVQEKAKTNKFPYYLIQENAPWSQQTNRLYRQTLVRDLSDAERKRRQSLFVQQRRRETNSWAQFLSSLKKLYKFERIPGVKGTQTKAGMNPYVIFDLRSGLPRSQAGPTG